MTKFLTALVLAVLSQQTLATTVAAGIEFLDVGTLDAGVTSTDDHFLTNYQTPTKTKAYSGADGNAATFTYGANDASGSPLNTLLGLSLSSAADVADVNLTLLLVGSNLHSGTVDLLGGSTDPNPVSFSLLPYDPDTEIFTGYTGFNSVAAAPPASDGGTAPIDDTDPPSPPIGIFALTINLADEFGSGFGTFDGVQLQIYGDGYDAAFVGTTAVIPVPAAVWLFGSGLIGFVGVAARRRK
jgi:hypothetical protein